MKIYTWIILIALLMAANTAKYAPPAVPVAGIAVVKAILRGTAYLGLEKAGRSYMGKHWGDFKTVINPIISLYPGIESDNDSISKESAIKALEALESNGNLKYALLSRLENLEIANEEIWIHIEMMYQIIALQDARIKRIEEHLGLPEYEDYTSITTVAEQKQVINNFKISLLTLLKEARYDFKEIDRDKVTLPGAIDYTFSTDVIKREILRCDIIKLPEAKIVYYFNKPGETTTYRPPEYVLPPGVVPATREEVIYTFIDLVKQVRDALPAIWEVSLSRNFGILTDTKNREYFEKRELEYLKRQYKNKWGHEPSRDRKYYLDDFKESYSLSAKTPDGRLLYVTFESSNPTRIGTKRTPKTYAVNITIYSAGKY